MIYLRVCRVGFCEICTASFHLEAEVPERCPVCNSTEWEWGVEPIDGIKVRMGIHRVSRKVNPGAKSLKRQVRGKQQWRQFKPKGER